MRCVTVESLTPDWIREKLDCINRRAWDHAGEIKELIGRKLGQRGYLTPEEFSRILVFKGLAKSKDAFLKEYQPLNAIQERTTELLASGLESYRFEDTADDGKRRDILEIAQKMMRLLVGIKYVGVPVSCAALRLTYPHLFGTVDYIVPGLLHCQKDDMGTENPLWAGFENGLALRECMRLPDGSGMSPNEARDLAQKNYRGYTEELWDIKWKLGLSEFEVSEIETAIWSYGICHIKRQKAENNRSQSLPFRFQVKPSSPRGGLFAKNCPNETNRAGFQAKVRVTAGGGSSRPQNEAAASDNIDVFYSVLARLADAPGQGLPLSDLLRGRFWLPERGVYFFFEAGECRTANPSVQRVVRVGTHAVSSGSKSTLRRRLEQHLGTRTGGGNHRGSIFRLHVGTALLARDGTPLPTWGVGSSAPPAVRENQDARAAEVACEKRVSEYIGGMSVFWIDVPDEAAPQSERAYIEKNAIALLSNQFAPIDKASDSWLGHFSPRREIRDSALWNLNYVADVCDPSFLDKFDSFVTLTCKLSRGQQVAAPSQPHSAYTTSTHQMVQEGELNRSAAQEVMPTLSEEKAPSAPCNSENEPIGRRRLETMNESKQAYIREVHISHETYRDLSLTRKRIITMRNTFMRVFKGRKHISKAQKAIEERTLSDYVSENVIAPLLANPSVWNNKEHYLTWHKDSIQAIIDHCPIAWDEGERLTVGMSQKIVNLLTKDFWALDIIPARYEHFLNVVIDNVVLDKLKLKIRTPWTKIDVYSDYKELQRRFTEHADRENRTNGTQYSAIEMENRIWLKGARGGRSRIEDRTQRNSE